jgi:hypothetical protein
MDGVLTSHPELAPLLDLLHGRVAGRCHRPATPDKLKSGFLKSGVTHGSDYEPEINATSRDFATHDGTVILPTRVVKPRDKANVETGGLIVEREIRAPRRDHRSTSLAARNEATAERLEVVDNRPFQLLAGARRPVFESSVFESLERATLPSGRPRRCTSTTMVEVVPRGRA